MPESNSCATYNAAPNFSQFLRCKHDGFAFMLLAFAALATRSRSVRAECQNCRGAELSNRRPARRTHFTRRRSGLRIAVSHTPLVVTGNAAFSDHAGAARGVHRHHVRQQRAQIAPCGAEKLPPPGRQNHAPAETGIAQSQPAEQTCTAMSSRRPFLSLLNAMRNDRAARRDLRPQSVVIGSRDCRQNGR